MKKALLIFLALLLFTVGVDASWQFNVFTGELDYWGKEYVDSTLGGVYFNYFLSDTATGEGAPLDTLDLMYPAETGAAASTVTKLITADATLVNAWVTEATEPTFTVLVPGTYTLYTHAHVDDDGASYKSTTIYWKLESCDADGQNPVTVIAASEESTVLTDTMTAYVLHGSLSAQTIIGDTDRLILSIYANEDGAAPNDPTVTITMEGDHDCRLAVLTTTTAFDDRYVLVEGDNMTGNLGIGSTSPAYALDVISAGGVGIGTTASGADFIVATTGNVGIGSTVPLSLLDVAGIISTTSNIRSEPKHLIVNIFDPLGVQTDDTQVCIWPLTPAALTVTKIEVTLDASGNEVAGDLKWADTFIGLGSAAVINDFDTSSGVRSDSSITSGSVASGKTMYLQFDSAPNTAITQMCVDVTFDFD